VLGFFNLKQNTMEVGKMYLLGSDEKPHVKVKLEEIDRGSGWLPADCWFSYAPEVKDEDKPIVHPDYGKNDIIKHEVLFPEGLIHVLQAKGYLKELA
jgi:hypothetical protein